MVQSDLFPFSPCCTGGLGLQYDPSVESPGNLLLHMQYFITYTISEETGINQFINSSFICLNVFLVRIRVWFKHKVALASTFPSFLLSKVAMGVQSFT